MADTDINVEGNATSPTIKWGNSNNGMIIHTGDVIVGESKTFTIDCDITARRIQTGGKTAATKSTLNIGTANNHNPVVVRLTQLSGWSSTNGALNTNDFTKLTVENAILKMGVSSQEPGGVIFGTYGRIANVEFEYLRNCTIGSYSDVTLRTPSVKGKIVTPHNALLQDVTFLGVGAIILNGDFHPDSRDIKFKPISKGYFLIANSPRDCTVRKIAIPGFSMDEADFRAQKGTLVDIQLTKELVFNNTAANTRTVELHKTLTTNIVGQTEIHRLFYSDNQYFYSNHHYRFRIYHNTTKLFDDFNIFGTKYTKEIMWKRLVRAAGTTDETITIPAASLRDYATTAIVTVTNQLPLRMVATRFGCKPMEKMLSASDIDISAASYLDDFALAGVMQENTNITETKKTIAHIGISNLQDMYNYFQLLYDDNPEDCNFESDILTISGEAIIIKTGWELRLDRLLNIKFRKGIRRPRPMVIDKINKRITIDPFILYRSPKLKTLKGTVHSSHDEHGFVSYVKSNGKVNLHFRNLNPNNFPVYLRFVRYSSGMGKKGPPVMSNGVGVAIRKTTASALVNGALTKGATTVTMDSMATGVSHSDFLNKFVYIDNFTYYVTATTTTSLTLQTGVIKDVADNKEIYLWETKLDEKPGNWWWGNTLSIEADPSTEYVYRLRCPGYEWIEKTITTGAYGDNIFEELVPLTDNTGATIYNKATEATQQAVLEGYNSANGRLYINNTTGKLVEVDLANAFIFLNRAIHEAALIFSIDHPIVLNAEKNGFNINEESQFELYLKATSTASVNFKFLVKETPGKVDSFHRFKSEVLAHRINFISEINNLITPAEVLEAVTNQIPDKMGESKLSLSTIAYSFSPATTITAGATTIPLTGFSDNWFKGHYIVINKGSNVIYRITAHENNQLILNLGVDANIATTDTINILVRTGTVERAVSTINAGVKKASQIIPHTDNL